MYENLTTLAGNYSLKTLSKGRMWLCGPELLVGSLYGRGGYMLPMLPLRTRGYMDLSFDGILINFHTFNFACIYVEHESLVKCARYKFIGMDPISIFPRCYVI